jgi:biotin carboxyl carrier protein
MSQISGKVGGFELVWLDTPKGPSGKARVRSITDGREIEVQWRRDAEGLWLEFPDRLVGYDFRAQVEDDGSRTYSLIQRGQSRGIQGLVFRRAGESEVSAGGASKKGLKLKSQMPGKIVRLLVKAGDEVSKDQPVLVMEAMKMENEIRAPQAGKIAQLLVAEGQNVETGALLVVLE